MFSDQQQYLYRFLTLLLFAACGGGDGATSGAWTTVACGESVFPAFCHLALLFIDLDEFQWNFGPLHDFIQVVMRLL